jgi:DNA-binding NtrC family response regulator
VCAYRQQNKMKFELHGQSKQLLYVDDEELLVELVTRTLERLGYRVSGFVDAELALAAFRARPQHFDVVVTDLSMTRMSGFDLAQALQAIRPDVPIVMTSGYVKAEDQERAMRMGLRDLILKPDTVDQLGRALDHVFNHAGAPSKPVVG